MEFFKINSKTIQSPNEINNTFEDLDVIERTMDGTMVVDIIGKKRIVNVNWNYLTKENMTLLSEEIKSSTFVTISFIDKETGTLTTMTSKPKNLSYSPYYDWVNDKVLWKDVSLSFVER